MGESNKSKFSDIITKGETQTDKININEFLTGLEKRILATTLKLIENIKNELVKSNELMIKTMFKFVKDGKPETPETSPIRSKKKKIGAQKDISNFENMDLETSTSVPSPGILPGTYKDGYNIIAPGRLH